MPWQWPWRRPNERDLFRIGDAYVPATAAGEAVTVDSALRLSTVFGCVRLLADSVSTLPLAVYRGGDRDPLALPPLLQAPSADFPQLSDWLWAVMASLLLRGNAWGVITARAGAGLLPAADQLQRHQPVEMIEVRDELNIEGRVPKRDHGPHSYEHRGERKRVRAHEDRVPRTQRRRGGPVSREEVVVPHERADEADALAVAICHAMAPPLLQAVG